MSKIITSKDECSEASFGAESREERMQSIIVRSSFRGSSCGVQARKPEQNRTAQFTQIFPTIFSEAVSEKKLATKVVAINIPF